MWTGTKALELLPLSYHGISEHEMSSIAAILIATNYTVRFYKHLYKSLLLTVIYICTFESHAIKYIVQWAGVHKLKQVISMVSSCMVCPTHQNLAFSSRTYITPLCLCIACTQNVGIDPLDGRLDTKSKGGV